MGIETRSLTLLSVLSAWVIASPASAQQSPPNWPGFAVGPVQERLAGNAGQTVRSSVTVVTTGTKKKTEFRVTVVDLAQVEADSPTPALQGKGVRSCAKWLAVAEKVEVPANGRVNLPYTVRIPGDGQGDYYGFLAIELSEKEKARSRIVFRTIPAIYVSVEVKVKNRPARLSLEVAGIRVEPATADSPAHAILKVSNPGEVKTSLEGDILFRGPSGGFPTSVPIPRRQTGGAIEIYPGAAVEIACPLPKPLPAGRYNAAVRGTLLGKRRMQSAFEVDLSAGGAKPAQGRFLTAEAFKVDMSVDPNVINIDLPSGASRTVTLRIRNNSDQQIQVAAQPREVRMEPDGMLTYPAEWSPGTEQWVQVFPDSLVVRPRAAAAIRAQATVPQGERRNGTSTCAVLVTAQTTEQVGKDTARSVGEFPVLVVARDPKAPAAKIESKGVELVRASATANPTTAVVRVKNTGGQLGEMFGHMWLQNGQGERLASLPIGQEHKELILPDGIREFRLSLPPLDKGQYSVFAKLSLGQDKEAPVEIRQDFKVATGIPEGLKGKKATVTKPPGRQ